MLSHTIKTNQLKIIKNYNLLIDALLAAGIDIGLEELDVDGNCSGLSAYYMFYARQNDKITFFTFLDFLDSLNQDKINKIVEGFTQQTDSTYWIATDSNEMIELHDLGRFLKNISSAQTEQSHRIIGADWERTNTFHCLQDELVKQLKFADLEKAHMVSVSVGNHEFIIERAGQGFFIFEPNKIVYPQILYESLEKVSAEILFVLKHSHLKNKDDQMACTLHFLSFTRSNYEIEKALLNYEKSTNGISQFEKKLINEYFSGLMSLTDLILVLLPMLPKNSQEQSIEELRERLVKHQGGVEYFDHNSYGPSIVVERAFCDGDATTLLHLTVQSNQLLFTQKLIKSTNVEIEDGNLETPLFGAVEFGLELMVRQLVSAGANILHKNKDGETPVQNAIDFEYDAILDVFLSTGKLDPTSLLLYAKDTKNPAIIKTLLSHNADPNCLMDDGRTLLHHAVLTNNMKLMETLIANGKTIKVNVRDNFGFTPLTLAIDPASNLQMIKLLVENGADFRGKDRHGSSAFLIALLRGKKEIVNYFLSKYPEDPDMLKMCECEDIFLKAMQILVSNKKPFFAKHDYPACLAKAKHTHSFYFEARLARQLYLQRGSNRTMTDEQIKSLCLNPGIVKLIDDKRVLKIIVDEISYLNLALNGQELDLLKKLQAKINEPQVENVYLDKFRKR